MGVRVLAVAVAMAAVATAADACQGQKVLYSDHFATYDQSWGTYGPELKFDGGRMVIRPDPATVYWQINDLADYAAVDACVDVMFVASGIADEVLAGIVFWYIDDDNLSVFQIDSSGHASFYERADGIWRETIPWGDTDLVPNGDGKTVPLRAVVKEKIASLYVGDQKLTDVAFDGALPAAGTKVGIIAGSASSVVSTIAFDNFVLTAPN
jgi:hypothetical protein